ncbi:MAG: GNAT family N-acetyltransferase [Rikenellaceae bacterium]|nr:GNAT family N-acetyltransferase [Rikenellaceae bacterium]
MRWDIFRRLIVELIRAEVGYWLGELCLEQGTATEALRTFRNYVFLQTEISGFMPRFGV